MSTASQWVFFVQMTGQVCLDLIGSVMKDVFEYLALPLWPLFAFKIVPSSSIPPLIGNFSEPEGFQVSDFYDKMFYVEISTPQFVL